MQNRQDTVLKISLLGSLSVTDSRGRDILLPGRKDRALTAYLAAHAGKPVARDRLVELIWPDAAEGLGRASLRQSLSTLRKALPEDTRSAVFANRDTISLNANQVETDLGRLENMNRDQGATTAETSYESSVLDDLAGISAGFDTWRATEQSRYTSLAIQFLLQTAETAESERRAADAVSVLTRVLALDPLAEDTSRRLMQAYVNLGRPEAALRQYRSLEIVLESELGVRPEKETQELSREIRAQRNRVAADDPPSPEPASGAPLGRPAVLVTPFIEIGETAEYFALGFTEGLILALARFQETPVIDLKTVKAASAEHNEEPMEMALAVGAGYVLSGAILQGANRLRVNVRLTETGSGQTIWAEKYDRDMGDILDVEDELSARVATAIAGRIEDENQRRARRTSMSDLGVIDWVMRGRYYLNQYTKSAEEEAKRCFEEALKRDPNCVPAIAGLAVSYLHDFEDTSSEVSGENLQTARELAERGIALDENNAHARYAMASSMCYLGGYEMALRHCNRALEINPNDYHNICTLGWILTFSGEVDEGVACNSKAISLNPYAPNGCLMVSGFGLIVQGRYEEAADNFSAIRAENMFKLGGLATCYWFLKRPREAELATEAFRALAERDFPGDSDRGFSQTSEYWRRLFNFAREEDAHSFYGAMNSAGIPV